MLKTLRNILIIIFIFGVVTAGFDYYRMSNNSKPVFNISSYNKVKHIQYYRGLFYQASRNTKINDDEDLTDSSNIKFYILSMPIEIQTDFNNDNLEYTLRTTDTSMCDGISKLYYADKNIKIYTYCLDSIEVFEKGDDKGSKLYNYLEKDSSFYENILQSMSFTGLLSDQSTEVYKSFDEDFIKDGLHVYRCNTTGISDVYIGSSSMTYHTDFCTYKDDDFKFLFKIEEDKSKTDNNSTDTKEKEIFYEDNEYYYEFDEPKKDRIYITAPAVRLSPEKRFSLTAVLYYNLLTIDDLKDKGLKFNKVKKENAS